MEGIVISFRLDNVLVTFKVKDPDFTDPDDAEAQQKASHAWKGNCCQEERR
jgi:hypothetical protein